MVKRTQEIAQEISVLMPVIARRVLLQFFQTVDISQTQIFTIVTLYEKQPVRLSELSHKLNIKAPTTSGIVDRLVRSGFVKRIPDKNDRRAVNISLTPKGESIAKKLRKTLQDRWRFLLSALSKRDQETYLKILRKIKGSIV